MKRLIRILARKYGIEKEIRQDQQQQDAGMIRAAAYWFSSDIEKMNLLMKASNQLKNTGNISGSWLRDNRI